VLKIDANSRTTNAGCGWTCKTTRPKCSKRRASGLTPFDQPTYPGLGIHEMGTARMGRDPKTSVLNGWNQVHAATNVYVTDGACMTSTASQNPSLDVYGSTGAGGAPCSGGVEEGECEE
jgi:choline dehydrogenase-like flavoprotein